MPIVAEKIISKKFWVGLITPVLYAIKREAATKNVKDTAWITIPGYMLSAVWDINPIKKPIPIE